MTNLKTTWIKLINFPRLVTRFRGNKRVKNLITLFIIVSGHGSRVVRIVRRTNMLVRVSKSPCFVSSHAYSHKQLKFCRVIIFSKQFQSHFGCIGKAKFRVTQTFLLFPPGMLFTDAFKSQCKM